MQATTRNYRIAALLSVIGALLMLGGTAEAATSKPAGMGDAAYRALVVRSEALNKMYRLDSYSVVPQGVTAAAANQALMLRSEALNQKYRLGSYSAVPRGATGAANQALMLRSEELNHAYRLGAFAPGTHGVTTGAGFSWSAFGIGAAAMLGFVVLAGGAILGGRHRWRTPRTLISS